MKKKTWWRSGFTIIEVTLVLAITGLLVVSVMGFLSGNINNRRYIDSYNELSATLKSVYSSVINVKNPREADEGSSIYCTLNTMWNENGGLVSNSTSDNFPGRTRCAVYGKLVTFGETNPETNQPDHNVHIYDVIGHIYTQNLDIENASGDNALVSLRSIGANVITMKSEANTCRMTTAGNHDIYEPLWQARIENTENHDPFVGAFLVTRSPISGTVHTYIYDEKGKTFNINQFMRKVNSEYVGNGSCEYGGIGSVTSVVADAGLYPAFGTLNRSESKGLYLENTKLQNKKDLDICVGSENHSLNSIGRRAIRIHADGSNSTAVELIDIDSEENPCRS